MLTASVVATVVATIPLATEATDATGAAICGDRDYNTNFINRKQIRTIETGDLNIFVSFFPPPNQAPELEGGASFKATRGSSMALSCDGIASLDSSATASTTSIVPLTD
jgi:hypothetical protein